MLVLDTHALVWWTGDPKRLSFRARRAIDDAERLGVPTIVFWETSLLVRKRRLDLDMSVAEWAREIQTIPRIEPLPLTVDIALLADSLPMHSDPVDRFLAASAIHHQTALVTKDNLLRRLRLVRTIW